jgi:glyoxylate/hydroxypyruvate reductase
MGTAAGEPPFHPAVLFIRRPGAPFANAMLQRFHVLDSLASGEPLAAFLAAAAAMPDPPRAAVIMGGGVIHADVAFLDAVPSICCLVSTAAGVNHIDLAECARRGVGVANSGTDYSVDVADHACNIPGLHLECYCAKI